MRQELFINCKKCGAEVSNLSEIMDGINKCESKLETVKGAVGNLSGAGYGQIVSSLASILDEIEEEKNGAKSLKEALEKSVQYYTKTEKKITGQVVKVESIEKWYTTFGDLITDVVNVRESIPGIIIEGLFLDDDVIEALGKIAGGTYISSYWKKGRLYLNLHNDGLNNSQVSEWLEKNLGGKWDKYKSRNMKDNGFAIYDKKTGNTRQMRYFDSITNDDLSDYLKNIKNSGKSFWKTAAKTAAVDELKFWKDFVGYSDEAGKLAKAGKALGAVGTVLTVGGDIVNNFYDSSTGEWSFSGNQVADCVADVGIDLAFGAGSAAAGAAVGSFFAPPLGTVVGAGVGVAVDVAANHIKLFDVNGDGQKDSLVETVKHGAHWVVDKGEKAVDYVIDKGEEVVDYVIDKGEKAVDYVIDKGEKAVDYVIDKGGEFVDDMLDKGADVIDDIGGWFSNAFSF